MKVYVCSHISFFISAVIYVFSPAALQVSIEAKIKESEETLAKADTEKAAREASVASPEISMGFCLENTAFFSEDEDDRICLGS